MAFIIILAVFLVLLRIFAAILFIVPEFILILIFAAIAAAVLVLMVIAEHFTDKITIRTKKHIKALAYFTALAFAISCGMYVFATSDYVKMRRKINVADLYGMSIENVQRKYYRPDIGNKYYEDGYVLCIAKIKENYDGIKYGENYYERYYLKTDENGIVTDVMVVKDN